MGYFDSSSDEESDEEWPKVATKKTVKKSFLDDSDSDSDDDIDFDESFVGAFKKKQAKAELKQKQFERDATETTQNTQGSDEDEEPKEDEPIYRETTVDWVETLRLLKKKSSRGKRGATQVRFADVVVTERLEYRQLEDSARSVNDAHHIAQDHDDIPWYERDYEELPWHLQPDLEEDDALTALCKKVLAARDDGKQQQNQKRLSLRAAVVEANVLGFALKLKSRVAIGSA